MTTTNTDCTDAGTALNSGQEAPACGAAAPANGGLHRTRTAGHPGMCLSGFASWWVEGGAVKPLVNQHDPLKVPVSPGHAFSSSCACEFCRDPEAWARARAVAIKAELAAVSSGIIMRKDTQSARCGAICPEQTDALCARSEGHVGRHEGNGLDWWDGADSRARVTATITLARAGDAVPAYVDLAPAPAPYVIDAQASENPTAHHETLRAMLERRAAENGARREKCAAELKTEVARAGKHAAASAEAIGRRHAAAWIALSDKHAAVCASPGTRAHTLRVIADAMELSGNQAGELVLDSHQVLDTELAQLFPAAPPARPFRERNPFDKATWEPEFKGNATEQPPAAPTTATASNVTMDALVSGDPLTVCRALWSGEAADDGAHVIRRLSELAHVYMADSDLETMHAELVAELLLALGAPRSARA